MGVDLTQRSKSEIGEESVGINTDCPLTSAHIYEGIVDVHGTHDVEHVNGGDNNTIAPDNVSGFIFRAIPLVIARGAIP